MAGGMDRTKTGRPTAGAVKSYAGKDSPKIRGNIAKRAASPGHKKNHPSGGAGKSLGGAIQSGLAKMAQRPAAPAPRPPAKPR